MTLAAQRLGTGEPLLLVHPNADAWKPVLPVLSTRYDCIAFDLPGFGNSPPLAPNAEPTAARLADVLQAELGQLGIDTPHIAGNSIGARIALELGRRQRARSLVVISPFGAGTPRENRRARRRMMFARAGTPMVRPFAPLIVRTPVGRTLLGMSGYQLARPWRHHGDDMISTMDDYFRARGFAPTVDAIVGAPADGLDEISCPVTIVWGANDRVLPARQAAQFAAQIPNAKVRILHRCGHVPMSDDVELVTRVILDATGVPSGAASRPASPTGAADHGSRRRASPR
jgi:pimeloyl-ACP methyl ester carboxylesterase